MQIRWGDAMTRKVAYLAEDSTGWPRGVKLEMNRLNVGEHAGKLALLGRQARANQLFIVPGEDAFLGKRRMRPADAATLPQLLGGRFQ